MGPFLPRGLDLNNFNLSTTYQEAYGNGLILPAIWFWRILLWEHLTLIPFFPNYLQVEDGLLALHINKFSFILTNLTDLLPRLLCAKFGCNLLSGSGEKNENAKSWRLTRRGQLLKPDQSLVRTFSSG